MTALWLLLTLVCLLASGFYSGSEMGLYCVNRLRLRLRAEKGDAPGAQALALLVQRQQRTVLGILLAQNLANYLLTVAATTFLAAAWAVHPARTEFYCAALLSPLVFVLGDVVPKNAFRIEADRWMYRSAGLLRVSVTLIRLTGVLWLLEAIARCGAWLARHEQRDDWGGPRAEVIGLLREGAAEGALTEEQARIVERVMNLSSIRVGSIMIPRRLVATVTADLSRSAFEHVVREHHYSRMPVMARDRRTVLGIVNVHDVLADDSGAGVREWLHAAVVIGAHETAASTLVQLRRAKAPLAIVTDPRHGFVGIVTLKDLVEEIFGELPV